MSPCGGSSQSRVKSWSEPAGLEQAPGDVVGEVAEVEGGAAEVFEASVHGFGGSVAGAGAVEGGQDILGSLRQPSSEGADLGRRVADAVIDRVDQRAVASAPSEKSIDQDLKEIAADHKARD